MFQFQTILSNLIIDFFRVCYLLMPVGKVKYMLTFDTCCFLIKIQNVFIAVYITFSLCTDMFSFSFLFSLYLILYVGVRQIYILLDQTFYDLRCLSFSDKDFSNNRIVQQCTHRIYYIFF